MVKCISARDLKLNPLCESIELSLAYQEHRHRVAKDIQQGKYLQPQPSASVPHARPATAPTSSSQPARPALTSNFTEVGLARGPRRREPKDSTEARIHYAKCEDYEEYYHSVAGSRMAFEHPSVAAHGVPKLREYDAPQARKPMWLGKPLPPLPVDPQEPVSGNSILGRQRPFPGNQISQGSTCQPFPTSREGSFAAGGDASQMASLRSQQPPNLRLPFSGEKRPYSDDSDESDWEVRSSDGIAYAAYFRNAAGPLTAQVSGIRESVFDKAVPLEGLSAAIENGLGGAKHNLQRPHLPKSAHVLSSSSGEIPIYCTPRQHPAPTFQARVSSTRCRISDTSDIDFDSVEEMWNEAAARAEARQEMARWQNDTTSTSRTPSRKPSTAHTTPISSLRSTSPHSRKPTPVQARAPTTDRFGDWL